MIGDERIEYLSLADAEHEISPLALLRELDRVLIEWLDALQIVTVIHVIEREGIAAASTVCEEEHDILERLGKLAPLEEHQLDCGETMSEPLADWLRIADRQQLRREHHREATVGCKEASGMYE